MHDIYEIKRKTHLDKLQLQKYLPFKIRLGETNIKLLLACLVGIGAGYASVFFRFVLHHMHNFFFGSVYTWLSGYSSYLLPLIPMMGAILLIPFSLRYPNEINGYGMPKFLISVHIKGGLIRTRSIFIRILTAAITISTGGAAGVEGPIAQIGGAVGSVIGRFFGMGSQRLKVLIACGAAGGIAAQFNAPLAGVLFAQEIIMVGEFQLQTFGVIVISSGLATAISRAYYSSAPTFGQLEYTFNGIYEFPLYILLGLIIGLCAYLFITIFFATSDYFKRLKLHAQAKPVLGAFLVGILGLINFSVLGDGYEIIRAALGTEQTMALGILALLVILKMLATSITLGSGNVGGVFAPSLFIGAMIGATFGGVVHYILPDLPIQQGSYALVGMGAFLAAATHAPMTAIFLLFELTNNYQVILPIMFASVLGVMVAHGFNKDSLDSMELSRQGISLSPSKEEGVLNSISVQEVMVSDYEIIRENMSFAEFMKFFPTSHSQYYPVFNNQDDFTGMVSFQDIREIILEEGLENLVVMKELAETNLIKLYPHDSLNDAIKKFGIKDIDALPVVLPENRAKLVGILKRKDVINTYNRAILVRDLAQKS
jgi:CIC family chloride channel protein